MRRFLDEGSVPAMRVVRRPGPATGPVGNREKGRGTQMSVVGTRTIHLCSDCDAETLERYHANRPNPLMPSELPTDGLER